METDHDPVTVGREDLDDDDMVGLRLLASGQALVLPASIGRLDEDQAELVALVQRRAAAVSDAQAALDLAVRDARRVDVSWSAIAWSTGFSDRGAAKRWGNDEGDD